MATITLPGTTANNAHRAVWDLRRAQDRRTSNTGKSQLTTYPDWRWFTELRIIPQSGSDLLAWSLALDQLADRSNVFQLGPPHYDGPGTGYSGSNPLVAGGSQTGTSLNVDGLPTSTNILSAGDYLSFAYTSPGGDTNYLLNRATSAVSSDGGGAATIPLLIPIRDSGPADNATVELQSPFTQFSLSEPRSHVEIEIKNLSAFVILAEEHLYV